MVGTVRHDPGLGAHDAKAEVLNSKGDIIKTYRRRDYGKGYKDMAHDHAKMVREEKKTLSSIIAESKRRGRPKKKRDMQGNVIDDDEQNS